MSHASASTNGTEEHLVGQVADEFLSRLNRGERPTIDEYTRRYPQHAEVLRDVLAALQVMRPASPDTGPPDTTLFEEVRLGDFRLLREIGRGGMGVVHEAEQVSL